MAEISARRSTRRSLGLGVSAHSEDPLALPVELVTHTLRYLPHASLRQAAGVSRLFYACAWDAGLYIQRWLVCGDPKRFRRQLAELDDLVKHALPRNLRLDLSFWWFSSRILGGLLPGDTYDSTHPRMDDVLPTVVSALPLLIHLSVKSSDIEQLTALLCRPMPRLRDLYLLFARREEFFTIPHDFLAGDAPLLRKLDLYNVTLATRPPPALSNVTSLRFSFDASPPAFSFAHHFPKLACLSLRSYSHQVPDPSKHFNLSGLSLDSLSIDSDMIPAIKRTVVLDNIPDLRCRYDYLSEINWLEPRSEEDTVDFSLRLVGHLDEDSQLSVLVVPAHRRWRRIYDVQEWFPEQLPLPSKHGGTARLTYLRVEYPYLHSFLSCDTAFSALKNLQVDLYSDALVWPPDANRLSAVAGLFRSEHKSAPTFDNTESPYNVPCPVLEQLSLFALEDRVTVRSHEVAFLGRALGQLARANGEKAALALIGIEFEKSQARALIELTFSAVRRYAFAGRDSLEDLDDGLWEHSRS